MDAMAAVVVMCIVAGGFVLLLTWWLFHPSVEHPPKKPRDSEIIGGWASNKPVQETPNPPAPKPTEEKQVADSPAFCTQCGKEVDRSFQFCGHCGAKLFAKPSLLRVNPADLGEGPPPPPVRVHREPVKSGTPDAGRAESLLFIRAYDSLKDTLVFYLWMLGGGIGILVLGNFMTGEPNDDSRSPILFLGGALLVGAVVLKFVLLFKICGLYAAKKLRAFWPVLATLLVPLGAIIVPLYVLDKFRSDRRG